MKKVICLCLVEILIMGITVGKSLGQSSEEILEEMIKAQGGREKLALIKDTTVIGDFEMVGMGMSGNMTRYHKEPNLIRYDYEVMGMHVTQAYDGEVAWNTNAQTGMTEEMPEIVAEYFKKDTLGFGAILSPKEYGISFAYKGKEKIEDKEYHVLEQSFSDGHTITMYIDKKTYLPYMTKAMTLDSMMMETEGKMIMSDYREVDGIMMAFQMNIIQGGEEFVASTTTEVKFNSGLKDALFKMEK